MTKAIRHGKTKSRLIEIQTEFNRDSERGDRIEWIESKPALSTAVRLVNGKLVSVAALADRDNNSRLTETLCHAKYLPSNW